MSTDTLTRPRPESLPDVVTRFDVEPILFGEDYPRAASAEAADYWTVYSRDAEGLALAQADVRTLTDALLWVSIVTPEPVSVDINPGTLAPGWMSTTVAPIDTATPGTDLTALLYDTAPGDNHAKTCDCEDGPEPTPDPDVWVTTVEATTARYVATGCEFHVPPGVKLLVDHAFPTSHEVIVKFPESPRCRAMTAFVSTADLTWEGHPAGTE